MSFTADLLQGLAEIIAADTTAVWRPSGVYTPAETGIVIGTVPQSPDAVVVLTAYPVRDEPVGADSVVGVQIRTRTGGADPRSTIDLDDEIFTALHSRPAGDIGGIRVTQIWRQSGTPMGADGNGRHERSSNYYLTVGRITPFRS